jgi:hypothetical protein
MENEERIYKIYLSINVLRQTIQPGGELLPALIKQV